MRLTLLKCKIHRLVVTDADLHYEGSFTLDSSLMEAAGLLPHERIDVLDVTNGERLTTYVIPGPPGSGVACANGAAAHLVRRGDVVILCSYAEMTAEEARVHEPVVVHVDTGNTPRREPVPAGAERS